MKGRFSIDQIVRILAEAELPGSSVQKVARKYDLSPKPFTGGEANIRAFQPQKPSGLRPWKRKIQGSKGC